MPAPSSAASVKDDGGTLPRFTWPDVAVITVTIGFISFLILNGVTVQSAAITAVSTVGAVVLLVLLPRRISDAVKLLRDIKSGLREDEEGRK